MVILPFARLPPFLDVCALVYGHTSTQTHRHSLSCFCASPQFTRGIACGSPERGGQPPPAHSPWDQATLRSAVWVLWQRTNTALLQIGIQSLWVSKCLSGYLSHQSPSTVLIPFLVQSYFLTASFESLKIYLWWLNALFRLPFALRALGRNHSIMQFILPHCSRVR